MLSKRALANPGYVLAAASYPGSLPAHGAPTQWKPLPDRHGIMVKPPEGHWNEVDKTTVWYLLSHECETTDVFTP